MSSSQLNWSSSDCCKWEGITCDSAARVKHISLPFKGLKLKEGFFSSSSLGNLTHLTLLNLSHNSLYGSFDQAGFFPYLSRLEILDLSYNILVGELPFSLLSSRMRILDLSSNHFHGLVPSSFFQEALNLTSFNISNNTFSGSIPSSICLHSIPSIQLLDFSSNSFNGSISGGIGKCSKLRIFRAGHNNLSGVLPNDIYNASKLEEISLPHNSLYGDISERIANLTTLTSLDLNTNGFTSMLPVTIGRLSKLKLLFLHFNHLNGSLPSSLMNCTNLIELNLAYNNLEGNISVLNFSQLSQLTKLDLGTNNLTGVIPRSLYSCKSLKAIRISYNKLEGEIHPDIRSLKSLSFLSLGHNRLTNITGAMTLLMHCKSLVFLAFPGSFVGEEMPDYLGMGDSDGFQNLRFLSLVDCELSGHIPTYFSKLKRLELLYIGNNRLTGSIPSWLGNLPRLYSIDLSSNLLSGEFPMELCRLPRLVSKGAAVQVDGGDDLELPLYSVQGTSVLQYKWSYFPLGISIRNNTISGSIPIEIGQLQLLHYLDLGNNKMTGSIPTNTQLQSFNSSAFEGNTNLCGAPLLNKCRTIEDKDPNSRDDVGSDNESDQVPWLHIFVVLGFIVGFWGVFGSLVLKKKWRYAYFSFVDTVQDRLYVCVWTTCRN
ncbi:receptor-like protein 3 [Argentina anserina]|uniref:receptor-like protein 3 n=1 Tax=Argentina anserina TaxID=57926 RepID=UPI002176802E|nr:receptor-like protein 3 [Potentilla anserina]